MAKRNDENDNLFQRLTKLFRSGPVVKRKIRAYKDAPVSTSHDTFKKTLSHVYSTAMSAYGSYDRNSRYSDFSEMLYTPEVSAALDVYSEEVTASDDKGRVLHIYSENRQIARLLEELFYDTLNIEFNMTPWVRSLPVRKNSAIPLLDGRTITIEELSAEVKRDGEAWVYSVEEETGQIVPGKVTWCDLTIENSKIVKVWLDDMSFVETSPEHEFILRDGSRKRADQLKSNDSLMPFYRRISDKEHKDNLSGYEKVYNPVSDNFIYTHRIVSKILQKPEVLPENNHHFVAHHASFNKRNNDPRHIEWLGDQDHIKLHGKLAREHNIFRRPDVVEKTRKAFDVYLRSQKRKDRLSKEMSGIYPKYFKEYNDSDLHKSHNEIRKITMSNLWCNIERKNTLSKKMTIKFDKACVAHLIRIINSEMKYFGLKTLQRKLINDEEFMHCFKMCNVGTKRNLEKTIHAEGLKSLIKKSGYKNHIDLIEKEAPEIAKLPWFLRAKKKSESKLCIEKANLMRQARKNHKVDHVEFIEETDDVYCMTVTGPKGENDRHNFMMCAKSANGDLFIDSGVCVSNCQFGDMFLFNDVSTEHGVLNVMPIPVNEIEREEGYDPTDPLAVRFRWVTQGNQILENWQVTHFRLLGNDSFLPYGSSILEPARRIWRQLILIEDAMLVYRVVRSPERRVFYIDVGAIPPEEVANYMEQAKTILRSNQVIDSKSGRVDQRYNPLCFYPDTVIPLLDGRNPTIKELAEIWASGERDLETYSIDNEKGGQIVPGKIVWAGKSGRATQKTIITLDDGGILEVTPDHKMMRRDGSIVKAKNIVQGDSLMPFYAKNETMSIDQPQEEKRAYEKVYNIKTDSFIYTHRLITADEECLAINKQGLLEIGCHVVHHKNFNKHDNSTKNLQLMTNKEHSAYHAKLGRENIIKYNKSDAKRAKTSEDNKKYKKAEKMGADYNGSSLHKEHNAIRKDAQLKSWSENKESRSSAMRYKWDENCQAIVIARIKSSKTFISMDNFTNMLSTDVEFIKCYSELNSHLARDPKKSCHKNGIGKLMTADYKDWKSMWAAHNPHSLGRFYKNNVVMPSKNEHVTNHKVAGAMTIDVEEQDVYNVTVDKYHNLAVGGKNAKKSLQLESSAVGFIVLFQSVDEDYFLPVRGTETGTRIDTLAGGTNVTAIEDVEYIQKKLFAALKVPKAYLSYDDSSGSKSNLSQIDIRFSRTINRIQRTVLSELNKLAIIHLYSHGFEGEDLLDFELSLSNPSTVAQQQKLEIYRAKLEIAGTAPEGMVDRYWIRKNIMNMTDDEIERIEQGRLDDKKTDLKIEGVTGEPVESSGGGGGHSSGGGTMMGGMPTPGEEGAEGEPGAAETQSGVPGSEGEPPEGEAPIGEEPGVENEPSEEDEESLFAGQEKSGKIIDEDDDASFVPYSIEDENAPVRAQQEMQTQLDKVLYKRKRIRHHGPEAMSNPDILKAVSHKRKGDTLTDPYDMHKTMSIDPFKESFESEFDNYFNKSEPVARRMSGNMQSTLKSLARRISNTATPATSIITESDDNDAKDED